MRKLLTIVAGTLISGSVLAGGLVTNNNQSAMFTRTQNRNASTGIDAVYYNPAGLTKLGNGFFASVNNQTIFQTQTITNNYVYLSGTKPRTYTGDVKAPVFPSVYVVYNTGKLSLSAGFNPVGGGGGATYKGGLPMFEAQAADIVPLLVSQGIPTTAYSADIYFKGSSVYFGYQANVAYKISDMLSVALGGRLTTAKNTAQGHINSISINPNYPAFGTAYNGSTVLASTFFTSGATFLTGLYTGANAFVSGLQPIITGGGGSVLLSNGTAVGLTTTQIGQIQQLLGAAGLTPAQIGASTISSSQATLSAAAPVFQAKSAAMTGYAAESGDRTVDAQQTGTGFAPIISVNITPVENLNISLKYEFKTKLTLKTKVIDGKNGGGLYIQDSTSIADIPAILSLGVEYKPIKKLTLAGTFNCYFDKNVDYDGQANVDIKMIDKNFLEFGLGAEYGLNDKLRVSAGWLATVTGVYAPNYNNDLSYSTSTNTIGAGFGYRISPMIDLNIGGQYTFYKTGSNTLTDLASYTETYAKKTWLVGIGLDFSFGK
ncbi:MAG: aromatic hydrocarbon degradation protein [Bacteroidales bacterium]